MTFSRLEPIGKLYGSDLSILKNATASTKLIFSTLRSLSETQYAKKHLGVLNLSTNDIANYGSNIYTARSVRRYLNNLNEKFGELYSERYLQTKQRLEIKLQRPVKNTGFVFIMAPSAPELLKPSLILCLSLMLDKAAFNFRQGLGFCVKSQQLKDIATELNISEKCVILCLKDLFESAIITSNSDTSFTANGLYSSGVIFAKDIMDEYSSLINLNQAVTACEYNENSADHIDNSSKSSVSTIRTSNQNKDRKNRTKMFLRVSTCEASRTRKVRKCSNGLNHIQEDRKKHNRIVKSQTATSLSIPNYSINSSECIYIDAIADIHSDTGNHINGTNAEFISNTCASFITFTETKEQGESSLRELKNINAKNKTTSSKSELSVDINSNINGSLLNSLKLFDQLVKGEKHNVINAQNPFNNLNLNKPVSRQNPVVKKFNGTLIGENGDVINSFNEDIKVK